ncbi:MAG: TonB-dependent receptor [Cyclobacteriaceae bacterium]|nr:TonB-dependent receptor [Cyclobacteriaceae bacterium]
MRKVWNILVSIVVLLPGFASAQYRQVTGYVTGFENREPLAFVNLHIAGTRLGTTTDVKGFFKLNVPDDLPTVKLVTSYVGYQPDTLLISGSQLKVNVHLREDVSNLSEVMVLSGTMKEVSKMNSPIPVEIYSPALFLKNPTPSLFESLSMINGVQPQLNCNVCNTGDIHINGMEGPYTMVLIDGMPIVSSLATVYGLSGIPNSLVKRIEVVKGPASTLYGSEAVGGIINIITKEASLAPRVKTDLLMTSYGEYNLDVAAKQMVKKSSSLVGLNYFNYSNKIDKNSDNFTDVTLQQRISIFNKWDFHRDQNRQASLAARYVYEDRWGGELQWNRNFRGSDQVYGESIYTNRAELLGKFQLPTSESIFIDYSYNYHVQDSYYGTIRYAANQHVAFAQVRWDKKIKQHDLLVGLPFRFTRYDDNTAGTASRDNDPVNQPMKTYLPGIFLQDEISLTKKLTTLAGLRYDHHNQHGNIFSPRLSFKYAANKNNTTRLSMGNGFRVVNLFTEDHAALTGAREVIIKSELLPEQSWNINLNQATNIPFTSGYLGLDASIFYTYFTNKIVGDYLTNPEAIIYDNLDGHAISNGITLNAEFAMINSLKIMTGITLMDVFQVTNELATSTKTPQLFAPVFSGTYTISYSFEQAGLLMDITGRINGPMHLPTVPNDFRPEQSPWFTLLNFQLTKIFRNNLELYGGIKNLLNFIPKDPLYYWHDPFAPEFDTSYNYAPVQGIRGFFGVRYTIQ